MNPRKLEMNARKLFVLDLNDRGARSFESSAMARRFSVKRLNSWMQVQEDVGGAAPFRPDIVLTDIDFEQDAFVRADVFHDCQGAKPLGPILALPYVGSRPVWALAVYSAHFTNRASPVMRSPWLLLPFGILAAKLEGKPFYSKHLAGGEAVPGTTALEDYLDGFSALSSETSALSEALQTYVGRLEQAVKAKRVRVTNAAPLRDCLTKLRNACGTHAATRVRIGPEIFVELYSRTYGLDRIQLSSLCANALLYETDEIDSVGLDKVVKIVERVCHTTDPILDKALNVIRIQDQAEDDLKPRPHFDKVAAKLYGGDPETVRREILQVGVLLANVHACVETDFVRVNKKAMCDRLGISGEGNVYRAWFGDRPSNRNRRTPSARKKVTTLLVDALDKFVDESGRPSNVLVWGQSVLNNEQKARIALFLDTGGYNVPAAARAYIS